MTKKPSGLLVCKEGSSPSSSCHTWPVKKVKSWIFFQLFSSLWPAAIVALDRTPIWATIDWGFYSETHFLFFASKTRRWSCLVFSKCSRQVFLERYAAPEPPWATDKQRVTPGNGPDVWASEGDLRLSIWENWRLTTDHGTRCRSPRPSVNFWVVFTQCVLLGFGKFAWICFSIAYPCPSWSSLPWQNLCLGKICATASVSVTLFSPPGDAWGFAGDLWLSFNVSEY